MIKRQPRGIPVGGRFAGTTHNEAAGVSLDSARNEINPIGVPGRGSTEHRHPVGRGCAGNRQDPAPGVPALTVTMPDGGTRSLHFPFGSQSDLEDGTPAEQHRNKDGRLIYQARLYDGFHFDADDGEPAVRIWREDGTIAKELRYWGSRPSPGPNGEPAVTEYHPDGSVASTTQLGNRDFRESIFEGTRGKPRAEAWPYAHFRSTPIQRGAPE